MHIGPEIGSRKSFENQRPATPEATETAARQAYMNDRFELKEGPETDNFVHVDVKPDQLSKTSLKELTQQVKLIENPPNRVTKLFRGTPKPADKVLADVHSQIEAYRTVENNPSVDAHLHQLEDLATRLRAKIPPESFAEPRSTVRSFAQIQEAVQRKSVLKTAQTVSNSIFPDKIIREDRALEALGLLQEQVSNLSNYDDSEAARIRTQLTEKIELLKKKYEIISIKQQALENANRLIKSSWANRENMDFRAAPQILKELEPLRNTLKAFGNDPDTIKALTNLNLLEARFNSLKRPVQSKSSGTKPEPEKPKKTTGFTKYTPPTPESQEDVTAAVRSTLQELDANKINQLNPASAFSLLGTLTNHQTQLARFQGTEDIKALQKSLSEIIKQVNLKAKFVIP